MHINLFPRLLLLRACEHASLKGFADTSLTRKGMRIQNRVNPGKLKQTNILTNLGLNKMERSNWNED